MPLTVLKMQVNCYINTNVESGFSLKEGFRYSQGRFVAPGDGEFCRLRLKINYVCKLAGNVTETRNCRCNEERHWCHDS